MNAASASCSSRASSAASQTAMWYCFAIDEAKTSVDAVNRLWRKRHRGAWHRVLRVRDTADYAVMHQAAVDHSAWWQRSGAGFVVIRPGEDGLDRAVFAFLLEHADKFATLWYGSVHRNPLGESLLDHTLFGRTDSSRGEAA